MRGKKYQDWPKEGMGYIYYIIHPTTNEVRYIGQTIKSVQYRLLMHINSAKLPNSNMSKTPIGKWMLKLLNEGLIPEIIIIECLPLAKLNDAEIKYIKDGRLKYRLLNVADGGVIEGRKKGSKQSKEFCERQSKARSGINNQNFVDLTGIKFNNLTVIKLDGFRNKCSWWLCKCDCGREVIVMGRKLCRTKSCGCARKTRWTDEAKQKLRDYNLKHKKIASNGQFIAVI